MSARHRITRIGSAVVFLAGLALGSLTSKSDFAEPRRIGDYWLLMGDFHVHAFPGDGGLAPWDLRAEARRRGLHVISITNHNHLIAANIARKLLPPGTLPLVLPGQEITTLRYHMAAVGITRAVADDLTAAAAIDSVHAQGGAAIAAHPVRLFWAGYDSAALALLDGTEVAHPTIRDGDDRLELLAFHARTSLRPKPVATIGSSDFHFAAPIGLCRTALLVREISLEGVIDAIRGGRTVAYDQFGRVYGDSALVRLIGSPPQPPTDRNLAGSIALALTWIGLIALVFGKN
jgi:hypothetical protein